MGLLSTAAVIAVVAIVIAGAAILLFHKPTGPAALTSAAAQALVINDIKAQNPNANVTVISVSNSTLSQKSWQIVASVIYNGSKPCPTLMIDLFDYPALGLQNFTANLYTKDCVINGLSEAPSYVISSPQIAIARSYSANNTAIRSYVSDFGYPNSVVTASFIGQGAAMNGTLAGNMTNVWLIKYSAPQANHSVYAVLGQNGTIMQTYNSSS